MNLKQAALSALVLVLMLATPVVGANAGHPAAEALDGQFIQLPSLEDGDGSEGAGGTITATPPTYGGDSGYRMTFHCPNVANPNTNDNAYVRCPVDIIDLADVMSNPVLVVDPKEIGYMAFNALHGGQGLQRPGNEPPTNSSRDNYVHQTHTVHYTRDGAHEIWNDNPYYSPLAPPPSRGNAEQPVTFLGATQLDGRKIFGTDNAMVLDAEGRVYLANIYAYKNDSAPKYDYAISVWKSGRVNRPVDYYQGVKTLKLPAGVVADSIFLTYAKDTNRVLALWRETNETSPQKEYITGMWTIPGRGAFWYPIKERQRIGECEGITNPLAIRGIVYVGCFAGKNYRMNPNATVAVLQIHGINTRGDAFTQSWIDQVPDFKYTARTNALLVHRYDDSMLAVQAGLTPTGTPLMRLSTGVAGGAWDPANEVGPKIDDLMKAKNLRPPGAKTIEARGTAAVFIQRSGNAHVVYMERYKYANGPPNPGAPEFFKAIAATHHDGQFMGLVPLGVDTGKDVADPNDPTRSRPTEAAGFCQVFEARTQGPDRSVFNDFHDTLLSWFNKAKEQREFIAYGDCGNVRFAEIREENFIAFVIPFPPGVPPIPLAVAGTSPAQVGTVAGALAGAMVLRMLAFKRKLAVEAPA